MRKLFHVERINKTLIQKGFFLFLLAFGLTSCVPRQAVDVSDYILVENGKEVFGQEKGLTAFIFQNSPTKIPFNQFIIDKYNLGATHDVDFWIFIEGMRFKVILYDNSDLEKHFDTTDYIASNVVADDAVVGSKVKFLAVSVVSESNEDCLADGSLFQNMVIKYLKNLKDEYNRL